MTDPYDDCPDWVIEDYLEQEADSFMDWCEIIDKETHNA